MPHLLYTLTRFILAIFFMTFGIAIMLLPWSPEMRSSLVQFILEGDRYLLFFGLAFFFIGLALLLYVVFSKSQKYYTLRLETCSVEENVVRKYLDSYWKKTFPAHAIPHTFSLKKNYLYIEANLPEIPEEQHADQNQRIKDELSDIFNRLLGYQKNVVLTISYDQN